MSDDAPPYVLPSKQPCRRHLINRNQSTSQILVLKITTYLNMSFLASRPYKRSILEPIVVPTSPRGNENSDGQLHRTQPNVTPLWTSTTHTFIGTGNRAPTTSWPPSKFSQDPADIPDDDIHNVYYDDENAKGPPGGGVYRMYGDPDTLKDGEAADVPAPRLVAKRYLPKQDSPGRDTSKPALTLLMLPCMSVPKEVS